MTQNYHITNPVKSDFEEKIPANYVSIVGVYENSKVIFTMGGCNDCYVLKQSGDTLKPGNNIRRTLNEGDVWLIPAYGENSVLTGSAIMSNKPVAVFSGSNKAYNQSENRNNYTISQELPEDAWGKNYLIPNFAGQTDYSYLNAFVKIANTTIKINGENKYNVKYSGGILDSGYIQIKTGDINIQHPTIEGVEISSENAINVVMVNFGTINSQTDILPFQMQIIPTEDFSKYAVFKIEDIQTDKINIIFKAQSAGKIPDGILISEINDGIFDWKKLSDFSPDLGIEFKSTTENGRAYNTKNITFLKSGTYAISSEEPVGVYQYGINDTVSYGFPVNGNFYEKESPDALSPHVEYSVCCRCEVHGRVIDEPRLDPENRSNLGLVYLDASDSYNYKFTLTDFLSGSDDKTDWNLIRYIPSQDSRAHLVFMDKSANRRDTVLFCESKIPVMEPDPVEYGTVNFETEPATKSLSVDVSKIGNTQIVDNLEMYLILDSDSLETKQYDINTYQNFDIMNLKDVNILPLLMQGNLTIDIKFTAKTKGSFKDSLGVVLVYKEPKDNVKYLQDLVYLSELKAVADDGTGVHSKTIKAADIKIINENGSLKFISDENYLLNNIEIYDLSGKLVLAEKVDRDLNGFSIQNEKIIHGIYIIKIKVNGLWINKKVII